MTPFTFISNIADFSSSFLIGVLCILMAFATILIYCSQQISAHGIASDTTPLNTLNYPIMIGFACYNFEGIGVVMPIMQKTGRKELFPMLLIAAIGTICFFFVVFGTVTYMAWGNFDAQIATEMLPADSVIVIILKVAFCVNMLFSYVIHVKPCNMIIEDWLFSPQTSNRVLNTSRFLVCLLGGLMAVLLAENLDKFIGLIGAFLCAPVAFMVPAILHMKVLAKSTFSKLVDVMIVLMSILIMIFCGW